MLPAKYRLKSREEFNGLFRTGKKLVSEHLIMKYSLGEKPEIKVGFSVGLKFSKRATVRNKVKRWLREAARIKLNIMNPGSKIIFVVNAKVDPKELNYSIIEKEMQDLLRKGKLL